MSAPAPILVCPLHFERRLLLKCGLEDSFRIETCGPGREGVARWIGANRRPEGPVVLVGLAGALVEGLAVGDVLDVDVVLAAGGKHIETTWAMPESLEIPRVQVTSKSRSVTSHEGKRSLQSITKAQIVDLESLAFAELAQDLGWEFGNRSGDLRSP